MAVRLLFLILFALVGTTPARAVDTAPQRVLRQYFTMLERHNYRAAWRMWESEVPLRRFAAAFRPYRTYMGSVTGAGEGDSAMGSTYMEVPVMVHGWMRDGRPFSERGTVTLRHIIGQGGTARRERWHIYRAEIPPHLD